MPTRNSKTIFDIILGAYLFIDECLRFLRCQQRKNKSGTAATTRVNEQCPKNLHTECWIRSVAAKLVHVTTISAARKVAKSDSLKKWFSRNKVKKLDQLQNEWSMWA